MERALFAVLLAALQGTTIAGPAENRTTSAPPPQDAVAVVELPPRPSLIVVRPPVQQVDEAAASVRPPSAVGVPVPAALGVQGLSPARNPAAPAALPGTISFPSERLQQADDRQDSVQAVWAWDNMADGCGSSKNCIGLPDGCYDSRSCRSLVTVQVIDGTFTFRMRASDAKWVAVGLADSTQMYDTSVIECVDDPTGVINAYMSYTPKHPNRGCVRLNNRAQAAIELINSRSMDGGIFCEVTRVNKTNVNGKQYYLDETPFFLHIASGSSLKPDGIGYHGPNRGAAARSRTLEDYAELGSVSNWPMRMHGALMVFAWMFAATVGTLAARYFKAAWGKATICGKAMWFAWHRMLMMLTVVLHIVAVFAALIFLEGWSSSSGTHGLLGAVTTALALLQGLAGLLRPAPDHKQRPVFNWAHRGQGYVTHVLAVVTIFLAVGLPGARLPSYVYYILAGYVAFYVALHAVHSLTEVKSYYFLIVVFGSAIFAISMLVLVIVGPAS